MELAADADAIPTLSMLKEKMEAVLHNGLMLLEAGSRHEHSQTGYGTVKMRES
jgi:hypothetical protein